MKRFLFAAACILLLTGCGKKEAPVEVNSLELGEEGALTAWSVADFDADYLDLEEFKEQAAEEIGAYNEEAGEERIALISCTEKEGRVTAAISYMSAEDYQAFNSVVCEIGSLKDLAVSGEVSSSDYFYDSSGELRTTLGELASREGTENWKYLAVGEPLRITLPGKVLFLNGDAEAEGSKIVQTGADMTDRVLLDAPCYIIYEEK